MSGHPTPEEAAAAYAAAPRGVWIVAGTRADEPYPCRCHERKYRKCSPAFCPCSGRPDPPSPDCCAVENTPQRAALASAEYRLRKDRERAVGKDE